METTELTELEKKEPMKENKMGTRTMLPLLLSMAFPPMLSMLIQSLYNIVDSMFVARYSENALTAVSLAFPLQTLIVACSVGIGVGVNSYIARKLGGAAAGGSGQCGNPRTSACSHSLHTLCNGRSILYRTVFQDVYG